MLEAVFLPPCRSSPRVPLGFMGLIALTLLIAGSGVSLRAAAHPRPVPDKLYIPLNNELLGKSRALIE
jgi:hypothetical protein